MATKQKYLGEPCAADLATLHLTRFIESFIATSRRERALALLVQKPKRRRDALVVLWDSLDPAYCRRLEGEGDSASSLLAKHGNREGVLVTGGGTGRLTLQDALRLEGSEDAIFSIDPGKLAFWMSHEFDVVECVRR
jgi:hypothetical protein